MRACVYVRLGWTRLAYCLSPYPWPRARGPLTSLMGRFPEWSVGDSLIVCKSRQTVQICQLQNSPLLSGVLEGGLEVLCLSHPRETVSQTCFGRLEVVTWPPRLVLGGCACVCVRAISPYLDDGPLFGEFLR